MTIYLYWAENWETPKKEAVEDKQNKGIAELLAGRRCPRKQEVIVKLKGETNEKYRNCKKN